MLWQPISVGGRELRNRIVVAPMSRVSTCGDGVPTEQMCDYYRKFSLGGFGLTISEGTYPLGPASRGYANQPGLTTPAQAAGWEAVTSAVHAAGGLIVAQLMHAGALSQHLTATLGPSAVTPRGQKMAEYGGSGPYPTPAAASEAEISDIIAGFAASAALAVDAGFDGVEVHAANGYLLDQFLTAHLNSRSGRYGGTAAARTQLTADVTTAVRDSTGGRILIGVRLSQAKVNDSHHQWADEQEATDIFATVAAARPDYLHLAGEGRPWTDNGRAADGTPLGALARDVTGVPVIVNGGLHTPELIARVLDSGEADLASLGTAALADPDWPARIRASQKPRPFDPAMITPAATVQNTYNFLHSPAGAPRS
ncbi:MAG: NADH:flavin oxidoreductase [Pseudonocardiales bacterium]|nr:MAG: NADH:flavin oxidoreductase [Pseudonocardiales bacterium]